MPCSLSGSRSCVSLPSNLCAYDCTNFALLCIHRFGVQTLSLLLAHAATFPPVCHMRSKTETLQGLPGSAPQTRRHDSGHVFRARIQRAAADGISHIVVVSVYSQSCAGVATPSAGSGRGVAAKSWRCHSVLGAVAHVPCFLLARSRSLQGVLPGGCKVETAQPQQYVESKRARESETRTGLDLGPTQSRLSWRNSCSCGSCMSCVCDVCGSERPGLT